LSQKCIFSPIFSSKIFLKSQHRSQINKIEASAEDINAAVFIPGQDGVLSVSSDRSEAGFSFFRYERN
jgi:hypothetical protein